jgi:hypothetical protein
MRSCKVRVYIKIKLTNYVATSCCDKLGTKQGFLLVVSPGGSSSRRTVVQKKLPQHCDEEHVRRARLVLGRQNWHRWALTDRLCVRP